MFSARLYPYGIEKGDALLENDVQRLPLRAPMLFMGTSLDELEVFFPLRCFSTMSLSHR